MTVIFIVGLAGVTINLALVTRVAKVSGTGNLVSSINTPVITNGVTLGTGISYHESVHNNPAIAMRTGASFTVFAPITLTLQTTSLKSPH